MVLALLNPRVCLGPWGRIRKGRGEGARRDKSKRTDMEKNAQNYRERGVMYTVYIYVGL